MRAIELFSRYVAYPLWNIKDRSPKLGEYRRLLNSQWCTRGEIERYQLGRLQFMLRYAHRTVPFYRERWGDGSIGYAISSIDDLNRFPILRKKDICSDKLRLISDEFGVEQLESAKTGGSTGVSMEVHFDQHCQQLRNAAAMMADSWAGWHPGLLTAVLWGSPPISTSLKERVRNWLYDRVFYLDTMRLDGQSMGEFHAELVRRKPKMLLGHAHSLYEFASFIQEEDLSFPDLRGIIATSMMLLPSDRRVIESVFSVKVTNRYGCEEVGLIACECERHDGLHINAEHVVVELVRDDDTPAAVGEEGRILLTDLNNFGMPLVRYEIGDVGVLYDHPCPCGRGLPLLREITGRTADYLIRADGSRVSGISLVEKTLTAIPGLEQLQIIQNGIHQFQLNAVIAQETKSAVSESLSQVLRDEFGSDARIDIRFVNKLDQSSSGKYRFAICNI